MNYAEFKDFLMDHLWKQGDSVVLSRLDQIIKVAEAELNRTLKIEDRNQLSDAEATDNLVPLPLDYREMRSLSNPYCRGMKYYTPNKFFDLESKYANRINYEAYTVVNHGEEIALLGPLSVDNPLSLTMVYYANIPSFQDADESWVVDKYLDLYAYCVLKHTAPFLREDERLGTWGALYTDAFTTTMEENENRKYAGSPIQMHFPKGVE